MHPLFIDIISVGAVKAINALSKGLSGMPDAIFLGSGNIQGYNIKMDNGDCITLKTKGLRNAFPLRCKVWVCKGNIFVEVYNSTGKVTAIIIDPIPDESFGNLASNMRNSNQKPYNSSIYIPNIGEAEIFFQTANCEHISETYREDAASKRGNERIHDLKFRDIDHVIRSAKYYKPIKGKTNKFVALTLFNNKVYETYYYLERRSDSKKLFAVVISSYISNKIEYINEVRNG